MLPKQSDYSTGQVVCFGEAAAGAGFVPAPPAHEGGPGFAGAPARQWDCRHFGAARNTLQQVLAAH